MLHEPMKSSPTSTVPSGASISSASTSSDLQQHAALGHGLLNQFGALVPRHALFSVNVEIDQLSNVPLISGQFAVRWKFKNVQTRSGLLSRMRGNQASWSSKGNGAATKGKGRASELGLAIEVTPADDDEDDGNESSPQDEGTEDEMYHRASGSSLDLTAMPYTPDTAMPPSATLATATPGDIHKLTSSTSLGSNMTTAVARGITPWQPLQNYNVKWDHQANVVLQMDVHRETGDLLPNEVKFVVMQVRGVVYQTYAGR